MKVSVRKSFQFVVKSSFDTIHNSKSQLLLSNFLYLACLVWMSLDYLSTESNGWGWLFVGFIS